MRASEIDDIVNFIIKYSPIDRDRNETRDHVIQHLAYKTCLVVYGKDSINAFARWNIKDDTVEVLDLILRPSLRGTDMVQRVINHCITEGLKVYPNLKIIRWQREFSDDSRYREFNIRDLIKGEVNGFN